MIKVQLLNNLCRSRYPHYKDRGSLCFRSARNNCAMESPIAALCVFHIFSQHPRTRTTISRALTLGLFIKLTLFQIQFLLWSFITDVITIFQNRFYCERIYITVILLKRLGSSEELLKCDCIFMKVFKCSRFQR
jgi:hypothetical protein